MTAYTFKIITLLGGLALFLFGMDIMGKALERQAGELHQSAAFAEQFAQYKARYAFPEEN